MSPRRQNSSETAGSGLEGPEQPVDAKGLGDPIPRCGSEFLVSAILTCLEWYLDTQLAATALSPDRHGPPGRNHLQRGRFSLTPQASSVAQAAGFPHEEAAHASSNFVSAQIFSLSCFFSTPRGGKAQNNQSTPRGWVIPSRGVGVSF